MPSSIVSEPGTQFGPCLIPCSHDTCTGLRDIAESVCRLCRRPINYDKWFSLDKGASSRTRRRYVHSDCLENQFQKGH